MIQIQLRKSNAYMGQDILGIDYDISMGFEVLRFLVRGTLSLLCVTMDHLLCHIQYYNYIFGLLIMKPMI